MLHQELENIYLFIKRLDATICALAGAVLNIKNVTGKYRIKLDRENGDNWTP